MFGREGERRRWWNSLDRLTPDEFLAIPGVGPRKLAPYRDAFLALLRES